MWNFFFRCKTSVFCAQMALHSTRRRKPVPTLVMLTAIKPLYILAVTILICIALDPDLIAQNVQHQPPKTNQHSICSEPNQVSSPNGSVNDFCLKMVCKIAIASECMCAITPPIRNWLEYMLKTILPRIARFIRFSQCHLINALVSVSSFFIHSFIQWVPLKYTHITQLFICRVRFQFARISLYLIHRNVVSIQIETMP